MSYAIEENIIAQRESGGVYWAPDLKNILIEFELREVKLLYDALLKALPAEGAELTSVFDPISKEFFYNLAERRRIEEKLFTVIKLLPRQ